MAKYVELAEKPEARKKQPKVNLRQQMVVKSRWKFTQDVDIIYGAPNPAFHQYVAAWDKANPRPAHTHSNDPVERQRVNDLYQKWNIDRQAMRAAAEATIGEYLPVVYRSVKAGDTFTVTDKFRTYFQPHGWSGERYTNTAVVLFDGETNEQGLEYGLIKDYIEPVSIPTVKQFVLRHKTSGLYYKSYEWAGYDTRTHKLEYGDTFMKGKRWDNLGKAKTSILMMTGYYAGLPGADEVLPEWGGGDQTMSKEQLEEFELVEFDKLSRTEVGVVSDFEEWFKRSWELRELTVKYGSSVRTTYKALEKANLLDSQKGMVVFTETDEAKLDEVGYHGDKTAINDVEKALIEQAIASMNVHKNSFKKAVDFKSMAVSFANKGAALMFKLSYTGSLKVTVLDLETLKEAVDG